MDISTGMQASKMYEDAMETVGGSHQQQSYFKIFLHMTLLEVAFQMIILTYIRVANADEVTYESLVEIVIILSEIIHI